VVGTDLVRSKNASLLFYLGAVKVSGLEISEESAECFRKLATGDGCFDAAPLLNNASQGIDRSATTSLPVHATDPTSRVR